MDKCQSICNNTSTYRSAKRHCGILFSTKYNLNIYISALFTYKDEYKSFIIDALGNVQVRYFFARNCEICCIRGPPVLFEIKKSNRTEVYQVNFIPKKIFILDNGKHREITYQEFLKLKSDKEIFGNRKFVGAHGMIFEADEKLYREYYSYKRHLLYIAETAAEENIEEVSYDVLSTAEFKISNAERDFVEDVELKIMSEILHRCIDLLNSKEKELIQALYFQGLSERDYAEFEGVSQNAIHKRKKRILAKLKKFIEK